MLGWKYKKSKKQEKKKETHMNEPSMFCVLSDNLLVITFRSGKVGQFQHMKAA